MKGFITNIQRMSIHDGPGIRSTIFLKGCNLRCKWCHNPETWSMKPQLQYIEDKCIHCFSCITVCEYEVLFIDSNRLSIHRERCTDCGKCTERCTSGALSWIGKEVDSSDIIHEILQDLIYYQKSGGGITLSGGEPLQQKDFALDILQKCREHRIHTAVETNLLTDVNTLEAFLPWVDLWMCDFKMADDTLHRKWTGHSNVPIIKNLEFLAKQAVPLTIRTPVIPNVNDSEEAIESICRFIRQLPNQPAYELLGFHSLGFVKFENLGMKNPLSNSAFLKKGQLQKLNEILIRYNLHNNKK